jgi:PIN domain nuclease of toxin-antitoxin system
MTGYLLDINAVLIALTAPEALSTAARAALLKGPNILSVVSYWEVYSRA